MENVLSLYRSINLLVTFPRIFERIYMLGDHYPKTILRLNDFSMHAFLTAVTSLLVTTSSIIHSYQVYHKPLKIDKNKPTI